MKRLILLFGVISCWISMNGQAYQVSSPSLCASASPDTIHYTFTQVPQPNGDATIKMLYYGDLDGGSGGQEEFVLYDENTNYIGVSQSASSQCGTSYDSVTFVVPQATVAQWAADGTISFKIYSKPNVNFATSLCPLGTCGIIKMSYSSITGPDDAGVLSIDSPAAFCPGNHSVIATIQNFGTNIIDSVDVNWSVNGVVQTPITYTGTLDTIGGLGSVAAQVTLGSYNFAAASSSNVDVWTTMPNGNADTVNVNDTASALLKPGIAGPTLFASTDTTTITTDLSWSASANATSYSILYGVTGFDPATAGSIQTTTSTSLTVSGLSPATDYDFYIYADCGGGTGISDTIGPVTVTTLCAVFTAPHTETFDNTSIPNCWSTYSSTSETWTFGTNSYAPSSDHTGNGGEYATVDDSESPSSPDVTLQSPTFDVSALTNPELKFFLASADATVTLTVEVWDGSVWNTAYTHAAATVNTWDSIVVNLNPFAGGDTIAVRFVVDESNGSFQNDIAIDDVTIQSGPACPAPVNVKVSNVTSSAADVSWNTGGATNWNLEYGVAGFALGSGTRVNPASTSYGLTGLSSNTAYDVYVRDSCAVGDVSTWMGPVNFKTLCAPLPTPHTETFDSTSIPSCWFNYSSTGETWTFGTNSYAPSSDHTGNGGEYATVDDSESPSSPDVTLESPLFDVTTLTNPELKFFLASTDNSVTLTVDVWDGSTWNIGVYTHAAATINTWDSIMVNLTPFAGRDTIAVRFVVDENNGSFQNDIAIDDVTIHSGPSCPAPVGLSVSNILPTAADASWNTGGANNWNLQYGPAGFALGSGTMANPTSTSFNLTGLSANTTYDVYVRDSCAVGDVSLWVGPITFTTPCSVTAAPYMEDFGNASGTTPPACWTNEAEGGGDWEFSTGTGQIPQAAEGDHTSGPGNGGVMAWIDDSDDEDSTNMLSPLVDLSSLTAPRLVLWMWSETNNTTPQQFPLHIDVKDASGWTHDVAVFDIENSGWDRFVVDLTPFSDTVQVRFSGEDLDGNFYKDIAIDDISFEETPACDIITSASITNIGITQATFSPDDSTARFQYEWGPCGFTQGTGTFGSDSSSTVLSGLTGNTCYDVYVLRDCDTAGFSTWTGPFSFTTLCASFTAPYSQNFDNSTEPDIDQCWTAINSTSSTSFVGTEGFANNSAPNSLELYNSGATSGDVMIVSPAFSDLDSTMQIKFYVNDDDDASDLIIGTMTDASNAITFVPYDTITAAEMPNDTWQQFTVRFDSLTGAHTYIAFRHGMGTTYDNIYIDDFQYEVAPACAPPIAASLGVSGITSASAVAFWGSSSGGDETQIEWGLSGFTPGTSTFLGSDSVNGTVDTIQITGLNPQTTYEFYIRDSCASIGFSPWIGPISFTTLCLPSSFPYFENFNAGVFPACWSRSSTTNVTLESSCSGRSNVIDINYEEEAITPFIDVSTATSLKVSYLIGAGACINDPEDTEHFHVEYWDGTQWVLVNDHDGTLPRSFVSQSFLVPPGGFSNNFQVRFNMIDGTTDAWQIDSVVVEQGPSCFPPTQLNAANIVDTSAVLDWNGQTSANSYQVWFGPQGFFQGTQTTGGVRTVVNADSLMSDTLSENSCYEYLVRAICSPTDTSAWAGPYTFCTPCGAIAAPYIEDFENSTVGHFDGEDNCWEFVSNNPGASASGGFSWEVRNTPQTTSTGTGPAGDNTLYPATGGKWIHSDNSGGSSGDSTMFISPVVDISGLTAPELKYHFHNFASPTSNYRQPLYVDIYDGSTWHNKVHDIDTVFQSADTDPWKDTIIDLTPYAVNGMIQVRFRSKITRSSGGAGDVAIDDVSIDNAVASDLELISAEFEKNSKCLGTNDTLIYTVANVKGGTYDLSTDPLVLHYDITGPVNSSGSQTFSSGTIAAGNSADFYLTGIDLSLAGNYSLEAWIAPNNFNLSALNDTLAIPSTIDVKEVWKVTPDTVVIISNPTDTVVLKAESSFFTGSDFMITEVSHYAGSGTGAPSGTWNIDDYIEITGVPGSDLAGYTLEQWENGSMDGSFTFTAGTVLGPNGTAVIAIGSGNTNADPANFIYDGRGTAGTWSSGGDAGRILKDPNGNIVDAVGYSGSSGYSFPAASGVTSADWSGNTASTTGTAGMRLEGPDVNGVTNWVLATTAGPQDPNVLNSNVPLPSPNSTAGFDWSLNGSVIDTMPETVVGPYSSSGVYNYVATFNGPCGAFIDTVTVVVNLSGSCPVPSNLTGTAVACDSILISWNNAADSSLVTFVTSGGTPTNSNLVIGDSSFAAVGVSPSTSYDFYVTNICGSDTSFRAGPFTINSGTAGAPVANFTASSPAFNATVEFDASPSFGARATYTWDFGDGNTGTGKDTIHTYAAGGSYNVTLTVANACGTHDTTITLADVSIGENPIEQSLVVYPNPTSDAVNISFDNAGDDEVTIRVLDLSGKQVMAIHSQATANTFEERINIVNLADGVYMLEISSGSMKANRRLIKQ